MPRINPNVVPTTGGATARPDQDLFNRDKLAWYQKQLDANPNYRLPVFPGTFRDNQQPYIIQNGRVLQNPAFKGYSNGNWFSDHPYLTAGLMAGAVIGPAVAGKLGTTSAIAPSTAANTGAGMTASNWLEIAKLGGGALADYLKGRAQGRQAEANTNQAQDRNATDLYRALIQANTNQNDFNLGSWRTQADLNNQENQFGLNRYNSDLATSTAKNTFGLGLHSAEIANADLDLRQRKFGLDAPGQRAGNAVRGDILSNARDVAFTGVSPKIPVPQISGGLRPSMFSDNTRALGANMSAQARREQEKGDTFAPLPNLPTYSGPTGSLPDYKSLGVPPPAYVAPPSAPSLTGLPQSGALDNILGTAGTVGSLAGLFGDYLKKYRRPAGTGDAGVGEGYP